MILGIAGGIAIIASLIMTFTTPDLGDIGYDLGYGGKIGDAGLILLGGVVGTIPTATDDRLGRRQWSIGPEFLIGKLSSWGALGVLLTHQWDFASAADDAALAALDTASTMIIEPEAAGIHERGGSGTAIA